MTKLEQLIGKGEAGWARLIKASEKSTTSPSLSAIGRPEPIAAIARGGRGEAAAKDAVTCDDFYVSVTKS